MALRINAAASTVLEKKTPKGKPCKFEEQHLWDIKKPEYGKNDTCVVFTDLQNFLLDIDGIKKKYKSPVAWEWKFNSPWDTPEGEKGDGYLHIHFLGNFSCIISVKKDIESEVKIFLKNHSLI